MPVRSRLDAELVRRSLAGSSQQAGELIAAGLVRVDGQPATKPTTRVDRAQAITVDSPVTEPRYVSRGGLKLAGALDALGDLAPHVAGRRALDAGASTGGFTDVLLRRGAAHVVAVDVGYGDLAWSLRTDERVTVIERTNVRTLTPETVAPPPELVVGDLSFISLTLVLPALIECCRPDADFFLMVKPQFEIAKGKLGPGGVVRTPELRIEAVTIVSDRAEQLGLGTRAITASPLPGPQGNVEFFVYLSADGGLDRAARVEAIQRAVDDGPRPELQSR